MDISQEELERAQVWEKSDHVFNNTKMTEFRRRARLQQSRWRDGKGYPAGTFQGRQLGSLLEDPEDEGRNFLTEHIRNAVSHRISNRESDQQLNEPRLKTNLLSSMPMCFNLFGELWDRPSDATRAIKAWLPGTEGEVESVRFEWSPGRVDPSYLGNKTAFDVAFLLKREDGTRGIVGIETKYHEVATKEDAPGPNRLPRYEEVTNASGAFTPDWSEKLVGTDLQQIWLDHLLVLAMLQHPAREWTWGRYVLVRPEGNSSFRELAERYREMLVDQSTFVELTIEQLLDAHVLPEDLERDFKARYLW